jgi:hypothetical protein
MDYAVWPQIREATPFLNEAGLYDYAVKALGRRMRTEASCGG